MYKVFFSERTIHLGEDYPEKISRSAGLIYRYHNLKELRELIDSFREMKHITNLHIFHEDMSMLMEKFRSCFRNIDAGGGVVMNERGEFLVIKRNGVWDLPKGKLDKEEDFESAALREVKEETGLEGVEPGYPIMTTYHTYDLDNKRVLKRTMWFMMHCPGNPELRLQESEGITDSRWVRPGETKYVKINSYGSILDVLTICNLL